MKVQVELYVVPESDCDKCLGAPVEAIIADGRAYLCARHYTRFVELSQDYPVEWLIAPKALKGDA